MKNLDFNPIMGNVESLRLSLSEKLDDVLSLSDKEIETAWEEVCNFYDEYAYTIEQCFTPVLTSEGWDVEIRRKNVIEERKNHIDDYRHENGCVASEYYIGTGLHTDQHSWTEDIPMTAYECHILDEDEYNHSILANACEYADFEEEYDNKNAKVLIVLFKKY